MKLHVTKTSRAPRILAFAGCLAAVTTLAFGQAEGQSSRSQQNDQWRSSTASRASQEANTQQLEGRIEFLFDHLRAMGGYSHDTKSSSSSPAYTGRTPSGQSASTTPSSTPPSSTTPTTSIGSSSSDLNQPLVLIVDSSSSSSSPYRSSSSSSSSSSPSRPSSPTTTTPSTTTTSPTAERPASAQTIPPSRQNPPLTGQSSSSSSTSSSTAQSSTSTTGSFSSGHQMYVLVFDPQDSESRMAYQNAQSLARSGSSMAYRSISDSSVTSREGGLREPQTTPGRTDPSIRERESTTPGASDRTYVREPSWAAGEKVKVTGCVLQGGSLQALAVKKVERASTASSSFENRSPSQTTTPDPNDPDRDRDRNNPTPD